MFIIVKEGTDLIYNCLFKSQKKCTRRDGELSFQLAIKLSTTTEKKLSYNICSIHTYDLCLSAILYVYSFLEKNSS